jgi:L-seryl-tRNA(Ser) seleniumtransferase
MPKDWYDRLKVDRIINAHGTLTSLGGHRMFPSAAEAMVQASSCFVELAELSRKAGEYLAKILHVEAALVTSGAAAALTEAAAACMVGSDPYWRATLPNPPLKNEIIIQCSHRNPFDRALRITGATLVEIGNAIETIPFELESSINEKTAAVVFFLQSQMLISSLSLEETLEIAHRHDVPVIVDAAAELPPKSNLWAIAQQGADLVIFSGGKDLRGPQTSGLMVGRKDLIAAAALQTAPYEYSIARPMKAGKELIFGLVAAVDEYLKEDETKRFKDWNAYCKIIIDDLEVIPDLIVNGYEPQQPKVQPAIVPRVEIRVRPTSPFSADELNRALRNGDPKIYVEQVKGSLIINPHTLSDAEIRVVIDKIKEMVSQLKQRSQT